MDGRKRVIEWGRFLWPIAAVVVAVAYSADGMLCFILSLYAGAIFFYLVLPWHYSEWEKPVEVRAARVYWFVRWIHWIMLATMIVVPVAYFAASMLLHNAPNWFEVESRRIVTDGYVAQSHPREYIELPADATQDQRIQDQCIFVAVGHSKVLKMLPAGLVVEIKVRPYTAAMLTIAGLSLFGLIMLGLFAGFAEVMAGHTLGISLKAAPGAA
jgi:hypothetical protein